MNSNNIWIIDHKASLAPYSPLNLDGSEWILGVFMIPSISQKLALSEFDSFLKSEEMELIEVFEIFKYEEEKFNDASSRSKQINNAARMIRDNGEPCYVYARTSEAIAHINKGDVTNA